MNNLPKIFWVFLALTVVLWIGVGIYYLIPKPQASPTLSISPTPFQLEQKSPSPSSETSCLIPGISAHWKQYLNSKFGYTLCYPAELTISEQGKIGNLLDDVAFVDSQEGKRVARLRIQIAQTPYEKYAGQVDKLAEEKEGIVENININNLEGKKLTLEGGGEDNQISFYFPGGREVLTYILTGYPKTTTGKTFDQMILTFRLTK